MRDEHPLQEHAVGDGVEDGGGSRFVLMPMCSSVQVTPINTTCKLLATLASRHHAAMPQIVHAGISALQDSGWATASPDSSDRYSSRATAADDLRHKGALGVRKQARDIMSGGWVRGGSAHGRDAAVPLLQQQQQQQQQHSKPQHVQGERAAYTQRPSSKGRDAVQQRYRGDQHEARMYSPMQFVSLADDPCDYDGSYKQHAYLSSDRKRSGDYRSSVPNTHAQAMIARPNSPDTAQEGEGRGGRPSTPEAVAFTHPSTLITAAATIPREISFDSSLARRSLVHLDLTGNRQVASCWMAV
jgi:hypothetical protein